MTAGQLGSMTGDEGLHPLFRIGDAWWRVSALVRVHGVDSRFSQHPGDVDELGVWVMKKLAIIGAERKNGVRSPKWTFCARVDDTIEDAGLVDGVQWLPVFDTFERRLMRPSQIAESVLFGITVDDGYSKESIVT